MFPDDSVEFRFSIKGQTIRKTLQSPTPLNQGDWHIINIEFDKYNLRLTFDTAKLLIEFPPSMEISNFKFDGNLYLGGISEK